MKEAFAAFVCLPCDFNCGNWQSISCAIAHVHGLSGVPASIWCCHGDERAW